MQGAAKLVRSGQAVAAEAQCLAKYLTKTVFLHPSKDYYHSDS